LPLALLLWRPAPLVADFIAPRVTFLRDVAPILNKVDAAGRSRRGQGQNGFKLSCADNDPRSIPSLLYTLRRPLQPRRSRQEPDAGNRRRRSAHGGDGGSERIPLYKTIYNWIAAGVPFGDRRKETCMSSVPNQDFS